MALFLGRGFSAWMKAWTQATPKLGRSKKITREILPLPDRIQGQMVSALASMVLDTLCKEVA